MPQFRDVVAIDLAGRERDLFEQGECRAQTVVDLSFTPVSKNFTGESVAKDGPRDRAVGARSKKALVQICRESTKQLALANRPFRRST